MSVITQTAVNGQSRGKPAKDALGRFVKGNQGGPGNPHIARMAERRRALDTALTPRDVIKAISVIREIMLDAKNERASDRLNAARLLLDRGLGSVVPMDVLARVEALEKLVAEDTESAEDDWDA